jgi:hypothetical protein
MVLTRNIFALFAGCGVAAVLLNMMEPKIVESAERFLRGNPEQQLSTTSEVQDFNLLAMTIDEEDLMAKLALAEFLINPSGKVNDAMNEEK